MTQGLHKAELTLHRTTDQNNQPHFPILVLRAFPPLDLRGSTANWQVSHESQEIMISLNESDFVNTSQFARSRDDREFGATHLPPAQFGDVAIMLTGSSAAAVAETFANAAKITLNVRRLNHDGGVQRENNLTVRLSPYANSADIAPLWDVPKRGEGDVKLIQPSPLRVA